MLCGAVPRKSPHAVALGRKGGQARAAALSPARRREIAQMGGRPSTYRLVKGELQRRNGDRWLTLEPPFDAAARAYLRRRKQLMPERASS
jgi:general stress protein YciG